MAADVLTYNALAEVNQELKAEIAALTVGITSASGGGGGGVDNTDNIAIMGGAGAPNAGMWCQIPKVAAAGGAWTNGFKVCDTTSYKRCGSSCTWTVPGGATCARFQVWGSGGGSGSGCCCGGSPAGGSGAYASVIMPVTAGQSYTLCGGCAYCCYTERAQMTQPGCPSYVQGQGLTNFCAEGGESSIFCESKTRGLIGVNQGSYCMWMGLCICNTGTDYCQSEQETGGVGHPNQYKDMNWQATANCKTFFGSGPSGTEVWGIPGQYSYSQYDYGSNEFCMWQPGIYGYPTESCCCWCMNNENSGCCFQACTGRMCLPGGGAWAYSTCGGDNSGCADVGRMGMVCVSYL